MTALKNPVSTRRALLNLPGLTGLRRQRAIPAIAAFIVFAIVYIAVDPNVLTSFQLETVANLAAPLSLVALGELVVVLVGGIDISVGALMSLCDVVFVSLMGHTSPFIAGIAAVATGVLCNGINGLLVGYGRLSAIATTLAASFIFGALALEVLSQPGGIVPLSVTNAVSGQLIPGLPAGFLWTVGIALMLWMILSGTVIGRRIYGVGSDPAALRATGDDPRRSVLIAFMLSGALTGLGAIMLAGSTATGDPNSGSPYLLNAIAAVALGGANFAGGRGSVLGTLCAAGILALVGDLLFFAHINSYWQYVVTALIIITVVIVPALLPRIRASYNRRRS